MLLVSGEGLLHACISSKRFYGTLSQDPHSNFLKYSHELRHIPTMTLHSLNKKTSMHCVIKEFLASQHMQRTWTIEQDS